MMTQGKRSNLEAQVARKDRLVRERVHDTYKSRKKPPDPTVCPDCGAVCCKGRWQWVAPPADAHEHVCPACQRVRDKYPGGFLHIGGPFLSGHREEILNLARNEGDKAKGQHPLKRIMAIEPESDGLLVTTTDPNLARSIGESLHNAYSGNLQFHYVQEDNLLRATWRR